MAKRDLRRERLNKIRDKIDKKTSVSRRKVEDVKTEEYSFMSEMFPVVIICIIIVCYLSTLGLCILTPGMLTSSNGRMFIPTGIIISALLIYGYIDANLLESKKIGILTKTLIVAYFVINIVNTINVTGMLKEGNNIDREISYEIQ